MDQKLLELEELQIKLQIFVDILLKRYIWTIFN